jgi:hypothetical protein
MQRTAIVVNCSAPHYNLGALKCRDWLTTRGYSVTYSQGDPGLWSYDTDLICLSTIFSWHAQVARSVALRMKDRAEIRCGGPGMYALANWWRKETGLEVVRGLDTRFDRKRGHYKMCFASRGCPVRCSFCLTPETSIQTADGLKPIVEVKVGDLVLTHLGRYRRVTEVLTREYSGTVHELRNGAASVLFPTIVTSEHPIWVQPIWEYRPRKNEPAPFAYLEPVRSF